VTRRLQPADDGEAAARAEGRRFANSPLGWALTAVGIVGLVALSFVSPFAALGVAVALAGVEAVDQLRKRFAGGPWLVEAKPSGPERDRVWRIPGRRRSAAAVREVAQALERGHAEPDIRGAERLK
jgi:hypothetical protein